MAQETANTELELMDIAGGRGGFGGSDLSPQGAGGSAALPAPGQNIYLTGMLLALLAIGMFFLALTSAYVVRKGTSDDWQSLVLPRILWLNSAVLVVSSVTLERARRRLGGEVSAFRRWWQLTTALGILFLVGQLIAWRQLAAAGVYLATNPSSSFFYLLTGLHGAHLFGGIVALLYVSVVAKAGPAARLRNLARITAVYWHFMDGLWIFLFLLLLLGR